MLDFIRIHPSDNVLVALRNIPAGTVFENVMVQRSVPAGHKVASAYIACGEQIIKYGSPIGRATVDIPAGEWVHTDNALTNLLEENTYVYEPNLQYPEPVEAESFLGYRRSDGKVGIRNEIWIIPTVGCVNGVAEALERNCQDLVSGSIDGLYAFPHPFGCSQTGADHAQTRRLLAALTRHPNAGAVLVLGLGCENLTRSEFEEELGVYNSQRVKFLVCQETSDEFAAGRALLEECAAYASQFHREECSCRDLVIGLKCGGSDGLSGITANPVVGRFSDMLVARGGSTVLTEVPEMFGAEQFLINRCVDDMVFKKAVAMIRGFKEYFIRHGETVYENPSPGNKAGGITTLEDKSCGCVQKGGFAPIVDVIDYGHIVTKKGLTMLCGPGNDLVSSTALAAAGAHLLLFTTGRGTPFGAPVPTLKISTNTPLAKHKSRWIDFNAGVVADGGCGLEQAAEDLFSLVLRAAAGQPTLSEAGGFRDIAIFKDGVTL